MFALFSPVVKYSWKDTGRRVPVPTYPVPTCVPYRPAGVTLAENEEVEGSTGIILAHEAGKPTGVRVGQIHSSEKCAAVMAGEKGQVMLLTPDLEQLLLNFGLSLCRKCAGAQVKELEQLVGAKVPA